MDLIEINLQDKSKETLVKETLMGFVIDEEKLKKLKIIFESELELGLKDGLKKSSLQMENTYIPFVSLPEKLEGSYLALDLGGTNFRVMFLEISKGKIVNEVVEYYSVQEAIRLGYGKILFDFLAECISDFVNEKLKIDTKSKSAKKLTLGFTFSFPMIQHGLNVGILVNWTKSFNASGVVGQDAVKMLNEAIKRRNDLEVDVVAILNDTTGTLIKGAYDDQQTGIGLILGTGSNAAYLEDAEKVLNWHGKRPNDVKEVIIDPEFGAFGDNHCIDFIKTEFDKELDNDSLLPGSFTYEKYFAGKYIGEIVRLALVQLHKINIFLSNNKNESIFKKDSLTAKMVSDILEDNSMTKKIFQEVLGTTIDHLNEDDCKIIEFVCSLVSERVGILVSMPMAVFIERMHWKKHVAIAVTGSLYKYHPTLKTLLDKYIGKMVPNRSFHTFLSDDGSVKGAGIVAAIASNLL